MRCKAKLTWILILVLIASSACTVLTLLPSLSQDSAQTESDWGAWAEVAWRYYTPGIGVDPQSLLHRANTQWHWFTDWDLGSYIQSLIDADKLKMIKVEPFFAERVEAILGFLERRDLSGNGFPYWSYSTYTGEPNKEAGETNPADIGRLLLALSTLRAYRPELASRIKKIVDRHNVSRVLERMGLEGGFYGYYAAQGFKAFGFASNKAVNRSLGEMTRLSKGPHLSIYGEQIPRAWITSEPILHTLLELPNLDDDLFQEYALRIYKVQELRFKATGNYTAFTEGCYFTYGNYIFEWIIRGDNGATWTIVSFDQGKAQTLNIPAVIYTKAAFAYHALFTSEYTHKLVDWLLSRKEIKTPSGFTEGVSEANELVSYTTDKTNAMILSAARHAIERTTNPSGEPSVKGAGSSAMATARTTISSVSPRSPSKPLAPPNISDALAAPNPTPTSKSQQ